MNRNLLYALLIFGELLIIAGFIMFLLPLQPINLFTLNLIVTMVIFATNYALIFDFGLSSQMRFGYAGMGLRWLAIVLFTMLSVVLVVGSFVWTLSFGVCLLLQLVLLFGVGLLLVFAKVAADNANRVLSRVDAEHNGLQLLQAQLTLMDVAGITSPFPIVVKELTQQLKDEINYLTVSLTPTSKALEADLMSRLKALTAVLQQGATDVELYKDGVNDCINIIQIRRKQPYN